MLNCANMAEFRVGRSADVLYVQFYAHVISDVKTKISGRRRKNISQPQTEMVVGLETEKDLEDERRRMASFIVVKFKFVFQHQTFHHEVVQLNTVT